MSVPSGIDAQLGVKQETTWGTAVVVDRFYEFLNESFETNVGNVESRGIGGGRFLRASRVKTYIKDASGTFVVPVMNLGAGLLLKHWLGAVSTNSAATPVIVHTFTPDTNGKLGLGLTVQVGRPDIGGTVRPFTYAGGKVISGELRCALDEELDLSLDMDFKSVVTATALASKSFAADMEPFIFVEGALTIGGSAKLVRSASVKFSDAMKTDRRFLGNSKLQPLPNGWAEVTGNLEAEFEDLDEYAAFVAGTTAELVLTFTTASVISVGNPFKLEVTIPAIQYTGETPKVGGPDVVMQALPFRVLNNETDPVITVELTTSDAAP